MPRFDLYRLSRAAGSGTPGVLVVDVQSPHLDYLESRIVVPLRQRAQAKPVTELHPSVSIDGDVYVLMTHALASVRRRDLGHAIGSLAGHRDEIARALDILITGF
jgi:toxin CcdB